MLKTSRKNNRISLFTMNETETSMKNKKGKWQNNKIIVNDI